MKKLHLFLSALALMALVACGDDENEYKIGGKKGEDTPVQTDDRQSNGPDIAKYSLEFPALKGGKSVVVVHNAKLNNNKTVVNFSVEWDTEMHAQRWTCYQMYSDVNVQNVQRYDKTHDVDNTLSYATGQYPNDPELSTAYQFTKDSYKGSGYDHGHICPSQDRVCSEEANRQTFCMTNMQPQNHPFNAGIWADMEAQVRTWAKNFDTLFVCKGGTIDKSEWIIKYLGSGSNKIPVPKYFFMAVLGKKGTNFKATGFWIAQDSYSSTNLKSYAVTISTLQQKTDIDFFVNLPDDIETQVENVSQAKMESEWTWYQ
jgi:endonuclease G